MSGALDWPKFVITRGDPIQRRGGIVRENVTELIGEGRTFELAQPSVSAGASHWEGALTHFLRNILSIEKKCRIRQKYSIEVTREPT